MAVNAKHTGSAALHGADALAHEFASEGLMIGPTTRMLLLQTDPQGGIYYQFDKRKAQILHLTDEFNMVHLIGIDVGAAVLLLDPPTNRLIALGAMPSGDLRAVLMGRHWGQWVDEEGRRHDSPNIVEMLQSLRMPVVINETKNSLSIDFLINIYHRQIYSRDAVTAFREGTVYHSLKLAFKYPTGAFIGARVTVFDADTNRMKNVYDIDGFPLIWPLPAGPSKNGAPSAASGNGDRPRTAPPQGAPVNHRQYGGSASDSGRASHPDDPAATAPGARPANGGHDGRQSRPDLPPSGPGPYANNMALVGASEPAPPPVQSLPPTEHLSINKLIAFLSAESDSERLWRLIEINLMQRRPERTYPLLLRYGDLITDRCLVWPPARLKAVFSRQPGSVMVGLMNDWCVNQVLAIAEDNPESDQILNFLREREIDRLMKLNIDREITSVEEARRALCIDRFADEPAIKKTWRTLLGFMNADHGRASERAIHRKKDEIAKHLQTARNVLLKSR